MKVERPPIVIIDERPSSEYPDGAIKITERQVELLSYAGKGLSDAEIGTLLGLSRSTIRTHFSAIYTKLNVTNRTGAVVVCLQTGVLDIEQLFDEMRWTNGIPPHP